MDDNTQYAPLTDLESDSQSLKGVEWEKAPVDQDNARKCFSASLLRQQWTLVLSSCLFFTSLILFIFSAQNWGIASNNWQLKQTSFYSPILDRYPIAFESKTVQGPPFEEATLTKEEALLRSYPSDEVDEAWSAYSELGPLIISSEEVRKLGKDPSTTVKAPLDMGYGSDAHLALLDGQHAIHCLHALRRYAYREYYYPNATSPGPGQSPFSALGQAHLSHCLHILLQTLTCNPSFDLITMRWVETQINPYPDFGIQKKCVNHNQLMEWQAKNKIPQDQWMEIGRRGPQLGDPVLPMAPKLAEWVASQGSKDAAEKQAEM